MFLTMTISTPILHMYQKRRELPILSNLEMKILMNMGKDHNTLISAKAL